MSSECDTFAPRATAIWLAAPICPLSAPIINKRIKFYTPIF
jgi:hypothetical protein